MPAKLLLADDSVTIQRVIELTFADEDVQVVAVGDGRQAIERIKADRPDIVLADVGMPERDGYEVSAFVKGDPQLAKIPVLLLTGAFEPIDDARARAVGCDGVLVKPFEPQMVISRVRDLLTGRKSAASPPETMAPPAPRIDRIAPAGASTRTGESIEDYFDRLDAAFATLGTPQPEAEPPAAAPRLAEAPGTAAAPSPAPVQAAAPGSAGIGDWDPDLSTAPAPAPPPAAAATPVRAPSAPAPPAPASSAPAAPSGPPSLSDAFAALLAAEQRQPAPVPPAALSDELIDEIARRVIERMGDESMRRAVLDAAERLVREEIDRIKNR